MLVDAMQNMDKGVCFCNYEECGSGLDELGAMRFGVINVTSAGRQVTLERGALYEPVEMALSIISLDMSYLMHNPKRWLFHCFPQPSHF